MCVVFGTGITVAELVEVELLLDVLVMLHTLAPVPVAVRVSGPVGRYMVVFPRGKGGCGTNDDLAVVAF